MNEVAREWSMRLQKLFASLVYDMNWANHPYLYKGIWEYDKQISLPQNVAYGSFPSKGP